MKSALLSAVGILSLFLSPPIFAQEKDRAIVASEIETIVTVIDIDRPGRIVTVRTPEGRDLAFNVPPEAQNLDQVHPGSRFRVKYLESIAVSVRKGGSASGSASRTVQLAPKGDTPGGVVVNTRQIAGVVESIDHGSRLVSLRGPEGRILIFTVDDDVQGLDIVQTGDTISVEYTESLAMRMMRE